MAKKMWAGRFEKATDKEVNDYNSSLPFDCKMYSQDIEGSIAAFDPKIISLCVIFNRH